MRRQPYNDEFLNKVQRFIDSQYRIDRNAGRFADGEADKALRESRLEEWFAEVTA